MGQRRWELERKSVRNDEVVVERKGNYRKALKFIG